MRKIGDLVPADLEDENPTRDVQIDVSKSYRGNQQARVKLKTGLGGGDCGFGFQIDKEYLVYASKDENWCTRNKHLHWNGSSGR